jgi:lipopolysaccharide biosynthesis glycosyltransferase
LLNYTNKEKINESVIFHYATGKPWNNLYSGACENIWYKYLKISPFENLYYEKYSKLKYKILRTGLFKFLFFEYIRLTPYINNLFLKIVSRERYDRLKKFYRDNIK